MKVLLTGEVTLENGAAVLREGRLPGRQGRLVLAYLVAEHGRPVPRDELADAIWGTAPPETWDKALAGVISKLRDVLDECGLDGTRALTHAFGCYRLTLPDDSWIDVTVAEAAVVDAAAALGAGDPGAAKAAATEAAAIARRPFLPGEEGEWVESKRRQLRDVHLRALECLADACLELAAPVESARWAEEAVELEPFRESAYRRLMLALAESGNTAEALRVYERCRRLFADELGAIPSREIQELHLRLLRDAPRPAPARAGVSEDPAAAVRTATGRGRQRRAVAILAAAAGAAAAAVALTSLGGGGSREAVVGRVPNGLTAFDGARGAEHASLSLGFSAGGVAAAGGEVWVTNPVAGTVLRVDGTTRTVRASIPVGADPGAVAAGAGSIWVANSGERTVSRINPATDDVVQTAAVGNGPSDVAVGAGGVWISNRLDGTVTRLDPRTGRPLKTVAIGSLPTAVAVADGALWVADQASASVSRLDVRDETVRDQINVGNGPDALVSSFGSVWVANSLDGTVSRIDPATDAVIATVPIGNGPLLLAAARDRIWVAAEGSGTVAALDPATNSMTRTFSLGSYPTMLASGSTLWLATGAPNRGHRGGTIRVAVASPEALDTVDPALADAPVSWEALSVAYDGLVGFKRTGGSSGDTLVPDLAIALPRPEDEGRTYVFRLRSGIRYADGTLVRAADLRRALERVLALQSYGSDYYRGIVGASSCRPHHCQLDRGIVADERLRTVTFHLTAADPAFLYKLALPFAVAVRASTDLVRASRPLPGTGPYRIERYVPGKVLRLVRNPRFREWSHVAQPGGYANTIVWSLGGTERALAADVARGRADVLESRPPDAQTNELLTRRAPQVHVSPLPATFIFSLNTRVPPFDDARVRRALAYAVDRGRVAQLLQGPLLAQPTCQFLPPGLPGYTPFCPFTAGEARGGRWQAPDLQAARTLVASSGTAGARVTVWELPRFAPVGHYLVALLNSLGYRATLEIVPLQRFFAESADSSKHVQASGFYWQAGYPAASELLLPFLCSSFVPRSPANMNFSEFCDRSFDAAVRRASAAESRKAGVAARWWAEADRRLVRDVAAVPLVNFRALDFVSRRFSNYQRHPVYGVLLDQAWVR